MRPESHIVRRLIALYRNVLRRQWTRWIKIPILPSCPLETLEPRMLLATYTVDADHSLADQLAAANANPGSDTILFDAAILSQGSVGAGDLAITEAVTFDLQGQALGIDADDVSVASGVTWLIQGDLTLAADSFTVGDHAVVTTRQIVGSDYETELSTAASYDFAVEAPTIEVQHDAKILTFANNGQTGGDITFSLDQHVLGYYVSEATVSATFSGATLHGNNITVTALADNARAFDNDNDFLDNYVEPVLDFLASVMPIVGIAIRHSDATISLADFDRGDSTFAPTVFNADGALTLTATANSKAEVLNMGLQAAFVYARSEPTANVTVAANSSLTAVGDLTLAANTSNIVSVFSSAKEASEKIPIDIVAVIVEAYSDAKASVAGSAISSGGKVSVTADSEKDISVTAAGGGTSETLGAAVVVSLSDATATAEVTGTARAATDLYIDANVTTVQNVAKAVSIIGDSFYAPVSDPIKAKVLATKAGQSVTAWTGKVKNWFTQKLHMDGPSEPGFLDNNGLSAAVAVSVHSNSATATLGGTGQAHGNVDVLSHISDPSQIAAIAEYKKATDEESGEPEAKHNAASAGVAVADYTNNADATIAADATVDAGGNLTVKAHTEIPYEGSWETWRGTGLSAITDKLNENLGIQHAFFNSWAQAASDAENVGLAASVNVGTFHNSADAKIDANAQINQDLAYRTAAQNVSVVSLIDVQTVNLSGVVKFFLDNLTTLNANPFGTDGAKTGGGGSYIGLYYVNTSTAIVASGATIDAHDVQVTADTKTRNVQIGVAGSKAEKYAIDGTFSFSSVSDTTTANIAVGAIVTAAGLLTVHAQDDVININIAGGVAESSNVGFGASVIFNRINRDTTASIGTLADTALPAGVLDLDVTGALTVEAHNSGWNACFALAAAVVSEEKDPEDSSDPLDGVSLPTLFGDAPPQGQTGVGIAGDVVLTICDDKTYAAIRANGTVDAGSVSVTANSSTNLISIAGAIAVSTTGTSTSAGIAGSFSSNAVVDDTQAYVETASITADAMTVDATRQGWIASITAGGSGAPRDNGVAISGSVSVNVVLPTTVAYVKGAQVTLTTDSNVTAQDKGQIWSLAGAGSFGGKGGYGVAISVNLIGFSNQIDLVPNRPALTKAYVEDSTITIAGGTLAVKALSDNPTVDPKIVSVTGALGVATGQGSNAGAGMVSVNIVKGTTEALVLNSTVFEDTLGDATTASLNVEATDDSWIVSVGGAVGVGQSTGIGAAISYNEIHNTLTAELTNAVVTVDGTTDVTADSRAVIGAGTVGVGVGSGSGGVGIAGSVSVNLIVNAIDAAIDGGSQITSAGAITVDAHDSSLIASVAGAVAGSAGTAAVGAAVGYNLISNAVSAYIDSSTVDSTGSTLTVSAVSSPLLIGIVVGGSGAQDVAIGGSLAVNSIANTIDAHIGGSTGASTIHSTGNLFVTAAESASLYDVTGAVAVATNGAAFGAAIAYNYVGGTFDAANPNVISYNDGTNGTKNPSIANSDTTDHAGVSAYIDNAAVTTEGSLSVQAGFMAPETLPNPASVDLSATQVPLPVAVTSQLTSVTVAAAGANSFALGGAISLNFVRNNVNAHISNTPAGTDVQAAGLVSVLAKDTSQVNTGAGSAAASGSTAIGASVAVNDIKNSVKAYIQAGDVRSTAAGVDVKATENSRSINLAVGGAGSGDVAISGSIAVNQIRNTVDARIAGGSDVQAVGDITLAATDTSVLATLAGNGGGAGSVAAAMAFAVNNIQNTVTSVISGSDVTSSAGSIVLDSDFAPPGILPDSIDAQVYALAISGTGAGTASAAGSVALNWIRNDVASVITGVGSGQSVSAATAITLTADDSSTINSVAGSGTGAGTGAAGASLSYNYLGGDPNAPLSQDNNKVRAVIENCAGPVTAPAITLRATYDGAINNITLAGSGAGTFSLAGSLSLNRIRNEVLASITSSADVTGSGDISLDATDTSTIRAVSGQGNGAGSLAVGAAFAYNEIFNTIRATISGSTVVSTAGSISLHSDSAAEIWSIAAGLSGSGTVSIAGSAATNLLGNTVESYIDNSTVTADANILVLADNTGTIHSIGGTISGGGAVGIGGTAVVNDISNTTRAYISGQSVIAAKGNGAAADVKSWDIDEHATQLTESVAGLAVIADSRETIDVVAVTAGVAPPTGGASVGIGANVVVNLVADQTHAFIDNSNVNSDAERGNVVRVRAHQDTDITSGGGALAVGDVGIGAVVDTDILTNQTSAYISDSDGVGPATIYAAGGVAVTATTRERVLTVVVGAGIGTYVGAAGGAAAVKIACSNGAYISNSNVYSSLALDVLANGRSDIDFFLGTLAGSAAVGAGGSVGVGLISNNTSAYLAAAVTTATATCVEATSLERVKTYEGTAGGGGIAGIAGSIMVISLDTSTSAYITGGARNSQVSSTSSVNVEAHDTAIVDDAIGTVALSLGGSLGASIEVVSVMNSVDAHIDHSTLSATSVTVDATSVKDIDSVIVAFAGSLANGVAGAVSVFSIGRGLGSTGSQQADKITSTVNGTISPAGGVDGLSQNPDDTTAATVRSHANGALFTVSTGQDATVSDTKAYIGEGSTITATAGSVVVHAQDTLTLDSITGAAALALFGFSVGGSMVVADIASGTLAYITGNTTVAARDNVTVQAQSQETVNAHAYGGSAGLIGALGAQVAIVNSTSSQRAYIGSADDDASATKITRGLLSVDADRTRTLSVQAKGASLGSVAAGAAVAQATAGGDTKAYIGDHAQIGQQAGLKVASLSVTADSIDTASAEVLAVAAGIGAGSGNNASATIVPQVEATIGNGADITVTGDVTVNATATPSAAVDSDGIAGGVAAVGVSIAKAVSSPDVISAIGSSTLHATGVTVNGTPALTFVANEGELTGNPTLTFAHNGGVLVGDPNVTFTSHAGLIRGTTTLTFVNGGGSLVGNPDLTFVNGARLTGAPSLTFTAHTITRGAGSWADEGFVAGQTVQISSTTGNNGRFVVDSVSGDGLTLTLQGGALTDETTASASMVALGEIRRAAGSWSGDGFLAGGNIAISGSTVNARIVRVDSISGDGTALLLEPGMAVKSETVSNVGVAGVSSIRRSDGSWLADNFAVGLPIQVTRSTNNNGIYGIYSISADGLTLFLNSGPSLTNGDETNVAIAGLSTLRRSGGSWTVDGFAASTPMLISGSAANNGIWDIDSVSSNGATLYLKSGQTVSNATEGGLSIRGVDTITRLAGTWVADQFTVGMPIQVSGTAGNNSIFDIADISPDGKTLTLPAGQSLANETRGSVTVAGLGTITRSAGNWSSDGFAVGQTVAVTGSSSNSGTFHVSRISSDGSVLHVLADETLVAESSSSATAATVSNLSLMSRLAMGAGGTSAVASATASSGGLVVVNATDASATGAATVATSVADGASLTFTGSVQINASADTTHRADAQGIQGGLLALGFNKALAGSGTVISSLVGDATITANSLSVFAGGTDDNFASTVSGSGGIISGTASQSTTSNASQTTVELGGMVRANRVAVNADHQTRFNSSADSINASIAGGSGAYATNTTTSTVSATIGADTDVLTRDLSVTAANRATKAWLSGYNIRSGSGGVLDLPSTISTTTITTITSVAIGDNSTMVVTGDRYNPGQFVLSALNDVHAYDRVKLDSGGAISIPSAKSFVTSNSSATVTLGQYNTLTSVGDISLWARTVSNVQAQANGKTYGLAGAAMGESGAAVNATQSVTVGAHSTLRAMGDVNLLAGQNAAGQVNDLRATANTDLYNKTAVPIPTDPVAKADIHQSNTVTIDADAFVGAVANVNLLAQRGVAVAVGQGVGKDLYREVLAAIGSAISNLFGGDDVSLDITYNHSVATYSGGVTVDGTAAAGIQNKQYLTIDKSGNVIAPGPSDGVTWALSPDESLTNSIQSEITRLEALKVQFSGLPDAVAAYNVQINALRDQLSDLGGDDVHVDFLDVGDLWAQSGDINTSGGYLVGTGILNAPGDVLIQVINHSPMFLRLARMTIPEGVGGHVTFNSAAVTSNTVTNPPTVGDDFASIVVAENSPAPLIEIQNTYAPGEAGNPVGLAPDVYITGDISNLGGVISVHNLKGSIRSSASINADTIEMLAPNGSFVQGYTLGTTHIGGDPRTRWNAVAGLTQAYGLNYPPSAGNNALWNLYENWFSARTKIENAVAAVDTVYLPRIFGNNVFISAEYLNLNSTIQSGIDNYSLTLPASLDAQILVLDALYEQAVAAGINPDPYTRLTSIDDVMTAYYNARTNSIELGQVQVRGGHMELFGQILSTGSGKLKVLDGYGRVHVDNNTSYPLVTSTIDAGRGNAGYLKIIDTSFHTPDGNPLATVYSLSGDNVSIVDSTAVDVDGNPIHPVSTTAGRSSSYQPASGQYYSWLLAQETWTTQQKHVDDYHSWFGLSEETDTTVTVTTVSVDGPYIVRGDVIMTNTGHTEAYYFTHVNQHADGSWAQTGHSDDVTLGWGHEEWWYSRTNYDKDFYQHCVKAFYPIAIEFTGTSQGEVSIESVKDVYINGTINNKSGQTTITSSTGAIEQSSETSTVSGLDVVLSAATGIGNTTTLRLDLQGGYLDASTTAGNVTISELSGTMTVKQAVTGSGNTTLLAERDIVAYDGTSLVQGNRISLTSDNGGIGTAGQALRILASSADASRDGLIAQSRESVNLQQVSGDLLVESIVSTVGDVSVTIDTGSLLDNNALETTDDRTRQQLLDLWNAMELTGPAALTAAQAGVDAFISARNQEYQAYWHLRNVAAVDDGMGGTTYTADAYDPDYQATLSDTERSYYEGLGWSQEQMDTLTQERAQQYHYLHATYSTYGDSYDPDWTYTLTAGQRQQLLAGHAWTQEELENSIGTWILETSQQDPTIEAANITGNNVVIVAGGAVGNDEPAKVIDLFVTENFFAPVTAVNAADDAITFGGPHGLMTGQAVVYSSGGLTAVGGLADATTYYAIRVSDTAIRLAATAADAQAGTCLQLDGSTAGGSRHTLKAPLATNTFDPATAVNSATGIITTAASHQLVTGQKVVYRMGAGATAIGGLENGGTYYVIRLSATTLSLAMTQEDALAGTPALTLDASVATGTSHSLRAALHLNDEQKLAFAAAQPGDVVIDETAGTATITQQTDVDVLAAGTLNAQADENLYIGSRGRLNVDYVYSTGDGAIRLAGMEGILNASSLPGRPNIRGGSLVLESGDHSIGLDDTLASPTPTAITIDLSAEATLTARAFQDIYITQMPASTSDINVDLVLTDARSDGHVQLFASGMILNAASQPNQANFACATLELQSSAGVGTLAQPILTKLRGANENLNVSVDGSVYLTETVGNLRLGQVIASDGNVVLVALGSILDARGGLATNVSGDDITLVAQFGNIGIAADEVQIDSAATNAGTVTLTAANSIYVVEVAGDLRLAVVTATAGETFLVAQGRILNGGSGGANIVSPTAILQSAGVGSLGSSLLTQVALLAGNAGSGDVYLENDGALEVGQAQGILGLTAEGNVVLVTHSPITFTQDVTVGGDLIATATDSAAAGDDLTVSAGVSIDAAGSILLRAGDDLTLASGSSLTAGGTVGLQADYGDADAGTGAAMDLRGEIIAPQVHITAGGDDDVISLTNTLSLTDVSAGAGSDIIRIGSLATPSANTGGVLATITQLLSIAGDDGSDSLYLDNTGDTTARDAKLMAHAILGLGMGSDGIAYDTIEQLYLNLGSGSTNMICLDSTAVAVINAGTAADRFRIGPVLDEDGFAIGEEVDGVFRDGSDIPGISEPMTINGNAGDDYFLINRNLAVLTLNGEAGDDVFELNTAVESVTSTVSGGGGADIISYLSNADVIIDGGDGSDTIILNGSLLDDHFIITADSLELVGSRFISVDDIERVVANGKTGNDFFEIDTTVDRDGNAASGSSLQVLEANGGFGSDTFHIRGILSGIVATIHGNDGSDVFVVGDEAHRVAKIQGPLSLYGDANQDQTASTDVVTIDNAGDSAHRSGRLTADTIAGLGMGDAGIRYLGVERLDVLLGSGNDVFDVVSSGASTLTSLQLGAGDDRLVMHDGQFITGTLAGQAGVDELDYSAWSNSVRVDLTECFATGIALGVTAGISGIENVTGGQADDWLIGDAGVNVLDGQGGDDILEGVGGSDRLIAGGGSNVLQGGMGDDVYVLTPEGNDEAIDTGGRDELNFSEASSGITLDLRQMNGQRQNLDFAGHTLRLTGLFKDLVGSQSDDVLTGNDAANVITGLAGDDRLDGRDGDDRVWGGEGNDALLGGDGRDTLDGGAGDDMLDGQAGVDRLYGRSGNDTLVGNTGDRLSGGAGNDTLRGNGGAMADYTDAPTGVAVDLQAGTASDGFGGTDTLESFAGVWGSGFDDTLRGGERAETFIGCAGNNVIQAGGGNDRVLYYDGVVSGNDSIDGGEGVNTVEIHGSTLGDEYTIDMQADAVRLRRTNLDPFTLTMQKVQTLLMLTGEGDDRVTVQSTLGSDLQRLEVGFRGGNDMLAGENATVSMRVEGGEGNDVFRGGSGRDTFVGGNGVNTADYSLAPAGITVRGGRSVTDGAANTDTLDGVQVIIGSPFADNMAAGSGTTALYGGEGNDTLRGSGHAATLFGQGGNDSLRGGKADRLVGGEGDDAITGGLADYSDSPAAVVVALLAGTAADGLGGNDRLTKVAGVIGSAHDDQLTGSKRRETIAGGPGNDVITGGKYGQIIWNDGDGSDTITGGLKGMLTVNGSQLAEALELSYVAGELRVTRTGPDAFTLGVRSMPQLAINSLGGDDVVTVGPLAGSGITKLTIDLGDGNDLLAGEAANTRLTALGGAGDDIFRSGSDKDRFIGGTGVNTVDYSLAASGVRIRLGSGGSGVDTGKDRLRQISIAIGTAFDDTMSGDGRGNRLYGGGGNDKLTAGGGSDMLYGQDGNDVLRGGKDDRLCGGAGDDQISGGIADYSDSPAGVLVDMTAGTAADGFGGSDTLGKLAGVVGSSHDDTITGSERAETITGGVGSDTIDARGGNDRILWSDGDGSDLVDGGAGRNHFVATFGDTADSACMGVYGGGVHFVQALLYIDPPQFDTSLANVQQVSISMGGGDDSVEIVELAGNGLEDIYVDLGSGNDRLDGTFGDLSLDADGGEGDDAFSGGIAADTFRGGNGSNTINYALAPAAVEVYLGSHAMDGHGNKDRLTGIENVIGSAFDDVIYGSGNANEIRSGFGNDTILAGGGDDLVYGGPGDDVIHGGAGTNVLYGEGGNDQLFADEGGGMLQGLDGNDTLTGGAGDCTLRGGGGDDVLIGGSGLQTLIGDAGNDDLRGGSGVQILDGRIGDDTLSAGGGNQRVYGWTGEDLLSGGTGASRLYGEEGDDDLHGGSKLPDSTAADMIDAGPGTNTIHEGTARDVIIQGTGNNTVIPAPA